MAAFSFYSGGLYQLNEKMLFESCMLLTKQPNVMQAVGLANYLFVNEVSSFALQEAMI